MKPVVTLVLASTVGALVAYAALYQRGHARLDAELMGFRPELQWLNKEFHLGAEQFTQIRRLEAAYEPRCRQLAAELETADQEAAKAIAANQEMAPSVQAALQRCLEVHATCQRETLEHVYAVAALMPAEDARVYIKNMLPSVLEPGVDPEWVVQKRKKLSER